MKKWLITALLLVCASAASGEGTTWVPPELKLSAGVGAAWSNPPAAGDRWKPYQFGTVRAGWLVSSHFAFQAEGLTRMTEWYPEIRLSAHVIF